jgi:hypothetical protein
MKVSALPESGITNIRTLLQTVLATLYNFWAHATSYQKFASLVGVLLISSAVFHIAVLVVTGGPWYGPVSWRKPILFGEAFGVTALSVAWVMTFLPKRRVIGWLLMGGLGVANVGEVFWVTMQQWRGVPSHFNYATPFDEAAFVMAGMLIAVTASVIGLVTLWSFVSLQAPRSLTWAIRLGLVLLLLSQVIGLSIIENGNAKVRDPRTGAYLSANVASAAVIGAAGAMKLPHALTLHAIQVVPAMALLLHFTTWSESRRTRIVLAAGVGYAGLVAFSLWQALNGLAPLDLSVLSALLLGGSLSLLVGAAVLVMVALRETIVQNNVIRATGAG